MTHRRSLSGLATVVAAFAITTTTLCAQTKAAPTSTAAKKEFAFKGSVQKVDAKANTLTVTNENVPGWMNTMTMIYGVDNPAVIGQLKAGDKITATVRAGDFQKLYGVKLAPPAPAKK